MTFGIVFDIKKHWSTADLAVFNVTLLSHAGIDNELDGFAAIGAV